MVCGKQLTPYVTVKIKYKKRVCNLSKKNGPNTIERLREAERGFISSRLIGESAIDKMDYSLEYVLIERYFPRTLECRVTYRDSLGEESGDEPVKTIAKILVSSLDDTCKDIWIPEGEPEVDPITGRPSIVPHDKKITGIVESIQGDKNRSDTILIGYVHMTEEGPIILDTTERIIEYADSSIVIRKGEVIIISPSINFTGDLTVTGNVNINGTVHVTGDVYANAFHSNQP